MQFLIKIIQSLLIFLRDRFALSSTLIKNESLFEQLKKLIVKRGGLWKDGKPFLFGIRNDQEINRFNDIVGIMYRNEAGQNEIFYCAGTTDPGEPWVKNPWSGQPGAAMLCEDIYNDVWILGNRGGSFAQLFGKKSILIFRQNGSKVRVSRDIDKDGLIDVNEPVIEGNFEIQFHPMSTNDRDGGSKKVGRWSAGCQGPARISDFRKIRDICQEYDQKTKKKNRYNYALFNVKDNQVPAELRKQAL